MGSIMSKPKKQKKYVIHMDRVIISNNNIYLMDKNEFKAKIITEKLIYDEVML